MRSPFATTWQRQSKLEAGPQAAKGACLAGSIPGLGRPRHYASVRTLAVMMVGLALLRRVANESTRIPISRTRGRYGEQIVAVAGTKGCNSNGRCLFKPSSPHRPDSKPG